MPAKAGIQAGRLRGCLVDSRFRGNDEFGTQLSSWAKPPRATTSPPTCSSFATYAPEADQTPGCSIFPNAPDDRLGKPDRRAPRRTAGWIYGIAGNVLH
jgi:hypothetical protein